MTTKLKAFSIMLIAFVFILSSKNMIGAPASGVVKGTVTDSESNLVLPGANVTIEGLTIGSVTDSKGNFVLVNIPDGNHKIKVHYIGYEDAVVDVKVNRGTQVKDIKLKPGSIKKSTVYIIGDALKGQAKALNQQRNNPNITNIVSSDQVGRFPDANIGDALKRIPGITMQYDQGEARFGLIRGTAARLNSVTINGDRIPSAEAENREVQLDLIPAEMIQSIEVNKAVTPDMDADAIGGSVNLVTRSVASGRRLSLTAGSGMNFLSEKPIWNGSLIAGDRFMDDKLGIVLSASYHNHNLGSDNIEAEWLQGPTGNAYLGDFQIRAYNVQRIRQSFSAGMDYELSNNHTLYMNAIYNHRNDWENRFRSRYRFDKGDAVEIDGEEYDGLPVGGISTGAVVVRETKGGLDDDINDNARLEDQRTYNLALGGDHLFGNIKLDWRANYAQASEERPHERYISYEYEGDLMQNTSNQKEPIAEFNDMSSASDLGNWSLDEITEEKQWTFDRDINAKFDIELPVMEGRDNSSLKFGGRYRGKSKERENEFFEYSPINDEYSTMNLIGTVDKTDNDFLAGDYKAGIFADRAALGKLDLKNASVFEEEDVISEYAAGNFDATENILAGYVMYNQRFGDKLFMIAGVRLENTSLEYNAYQYNDDNDEVTKTQGDDSYLNILPGIHFKYNMNEKMVLRAAWTNTLARPNYFDLAPYREIAVDDNELAEGNPELEPTKSMNIDLMADYFFESIGLVSCGIFYKDISDYIFEYTVKDYVDPVSGNTYDKYFNPRNGASASLLGFEIAIQRQLDFLPGFLDGLGVYVNYTFTKSQLEDQPIEDREGDDLELPGTADNMINASLFYEKYGFNMRISVNSTSAYIDALSDDKFDDVYYDSQLFLDINAAYEINDNIRVFAEAKNLTNQPLRYYQGVSSRLYQAEYYNSRVNLGVKFNL